MKLSGYGAKQVSQEKIVETREKTNSKAAQLKEGESYKGKLTSIDGNKVKININGKEYSATIDSGNLNGKGVGDQIELSVKQLAPEMLIDIKSDMQASNVKSLDGLIQLLNISKSEENIGIINLLKEFKIPITKENFEDVKSFIKTKSLMISTLDKEIISDKETNTLPSTINLSKILNKEIGIKENLINIFKAQSNVTESKNSETSANVQLSNLKEELTQSLSKSQNNTINNDLKVDNNTQKLQNDITKNTIENLKNTSTEINIKESNDSLKSENNQQNKMQNDEISALLKITNSLKNIDESSFIFNKEMQISNVIKNLIGFDNLINMKNSIVNQLESVLEAALKHSEDKSELKLILKELIDIKVDEFSKLETLLDKIKTTIDSQKTESVDKLKEDISILKDSIDYIKEVNNQVVYIQTPININGEIRDLEMGFKKSKDSKDGSFKIFISLETINIGLVQCLLKTKNTDVEVAFKVEEEFDDYFSDNHHMIIEELANQGYTKISVSNIIREEKLNLTNLIREDSNTISEFNFLI